jgi:hypothetical protein
MICAKNSFCKSNSKKKSSFCKGLWAILLLDGKRGVTQDTEKGKALLRAATTARGSSFHAIQRRAREYYSAEKRPYSNLEHEFTIAKMQGYPEDAELRWKGLYNYMKEGEERFDAIEANEPVKEVEEKDRSVKPVQKVAKIEDSQNAALLKACYENDLAKATTALSKGADPNCCDTKEKGAAIPLYIAAVSRQRKLVRLLLEYGADVNKTCANKVTPLHGAAAGGSLPIILLLVDSGANLKAVNGAFQTPEHTAEAYGWDAEAKGLRDLAALAK